MTDFFKRRTAAQKKVDERKRRAKERKRIITAPDSMCRILCIRRDKNGRAIPGSEFIINDHDTYTEAKKLVDEYNDNHPESGVSWVINNDEGIRSRGAAEEEEQQAA